MKPKKYNTFYAKLSNLILSMTEKQQEKLFDLANKIKKDENFFEKKGYKYPPLYFALGVLSGWGLVTLVFITLTAN